MDREHLKENAKSLLKGKYGKAITVFIIYTIIVSLGSIIIKFLPQITVDNNKSLSSLASAIDYILSCIVILGFKEYYLKISRGENPEVNTLFSHSKDFLKVFMIQLITGLMIAIGLILLVVPGVIIAIGLSQVLYITIDNPDIKLNEAIRKSKEMMNGHKKRIFLLTIKFYRMAYT